MDHQIDRKGSSSVLEHEPVEHPEGSKSPSMDVPNADSTDTAAIGAHNASRCPITPRRLKKFALFSKLPIELRFKIWNLSPEHRTIEMRFANNCRSTQYDLVFSRVPAVLHVHQESRIEGLRSYNLLFGHKKQCRQPVYFNPEIDRLHLRDLKWGGMHPKQVAATLQLMPNKEDVRHLSIKREWLDWANSEGEVRPFLFLFPNLEQLRVCFAITERDLYHTGVGYGQAKHTGRCKKSNTGGSCFTPLRDAQFTKLGSHDTEPDTEYGDKQRKGSRRVIRAFLKRHKGGFWGNIDWKQPAVIHAGLCVKNVQTSHCPPLGLGRAKAKRDAEAAKTLAAPQGVTMSGEGVGQSKPESEVKDNEENNLEDDD
ncbi:uncharacterized protein PAC_11507 [Phialocephala subalpina]|uniref:2EXR domain-containing protein n=1 Tax=Phialocephala subalpina TaxID=576137 RepID=A0A1L7X9B6_9HELO|nr:uncharacterized protein PAC_11507 [Phialocephala subalpina]